MYYYLLFLNNFNYSLYKLITIFVKLNFDINILVIIGYFIGFLLLK